MVRGPFLVIFAITLLPYYPIKYGPQNGPYTMDPLNPHLVGVVFSGKLVDWIFEFCLAP